MDSCELSLYVIVASSLSFPSFAWSIVDMVKPSVLPRIRRDCRRPSRELFDPITAVCAKTHEPLLFPSGNVMLES